MPRSMPSWAALQPDIVVLIAQALVRGATHSWQRRCPKDSPQHFCGRSCCISARAAAVSVACQLACMIRACKAWQNALTACEDVLWRPPTLVSLVRSEPTLATPPPSLQSTAKRTCAERVPIPLATVPLSPSHGHDALHGCQTELLATCLCEAACAVDPSPPRTRAIRADLHCRAVQGRHVSAR